MTYLAQLPKAEFDGIQFPVKNYEVIGGLRDHVHEYPHSPGGAVEKLGRKLYTFRFTALFDQRVSGYGDNLLPGDASDLNDRFDDQVTSTLVVPHIGSVQAYAVSWTHKVSADLQSGIEVDIEFREDQAQAFLYEGLVNTTATTLQSAGVQFDAAFDPLLAGGTLDPKLPSRVKPPPVGTIPRAKTVVAAFSQLRQTDATALEKIRSGYRLAQTIAEKPEQYAGQILTVSESIITTCTQWYDKIRVFKNPLAHRQARAFKRVWSSAVDLRDSVGGRKSRILYFRAPTDTSLVAVSRAIYGTSTQANQILQLNAIPNPFMIPKSTVLRYYDPRSLADQAA
jgi:hypothetical protein